MKDPHKIFKEYLESIDSRYTTQKKDITTEVFKMKDHFEVEDFIETLRKKKASTSRATIYRTIKQLLEAGLLQKINAKDGKVFYEGTSSQTQHAHVICNICGKILEIKNKELDALLKKCCDEMSFTAEYQSLHIYGQCTDEKACKKRKAS